MKRLTLSVSMIACLAAFGCDAPTDEFAGGGTAATDRHNPNSTQLTNDPGVKLLSGYNAFLDAASVARCVAPGSSPETVAVGEIETEFYLKKVSSKEDLAKELNIELGASLKLPSASANVGLKLVNSLKRSSSSVNYVVRAVSRYTATSQGEPRLSDEGLKWTDSPAAFLEKCGASFVSSVQYEAQVVGLLQFETHSENAVRDIEASLGGEGKVAAVEAGASIKTKVGKLTEKNNASLSVSVFTSGLDSDKPITVGGVAEDTFAKIDELRAQMATSVARDREADHKDYFKSTKRSARSIRITQRSYALLPNTPPGSAAVREAVLTLQRSEEFFRPVATAQVRMERVHEEEIQEFLKDVKEQHRYNIVGKPELTTAALGPIAKAWAAKFRPEEGTLVAPLRRALSACQTNAANGDYSACTSDKATDGDIAAAVSGVTEYLASGRIVRMNLTPAAGGAMRHGDANAACAKMGMRLPKYTELRAVAPAVGALGGEAGMWFAADNRCDTPFFANDRGQGAASCDATLLGTTKRRALCVPNDGPEGVHPEP